MGMNLPWHVVRPAGGSGNAPFVNPSHRGLTVEPGNVMFLALRADGMTGAWSVADGCDYALMDRTHGNRLVPCPWNED